jgi:OFA family oxalate/formate antiporter-like MFS transporter
MISNYTISMTMSQSAGWLTVFGGFVIHLVLGTLYLWANITSAVTSYLKSFNPNITYNDTIIIFAASLAAQGMTMLIGGIISQKVGVRNSCILGGVTIFIGTLSASLSTSLGGMVASQGIMLGVGLGLCYTAPISAAVKHLPHRKGLVTGISSSVASLHLTSGSLLR